MYLEEKGHKKSSTKTMHWQVLVLQTHPSGMWWQQCRGEGICLPLEGIGHCSGSLPRSQGSSRHPHIMTTASSQADPAPFLWAHLPAAAPSALVGLPAWLCPLQRQDLLPTSEVPERCGGKASAWRDFTEVNGIATDVPQNQSYFYHSLYLADSILFSVLFSVCLSPTCRGN